MFTVTEYAALITGFQSILFCYDPTRDQFHTFQFQ